MKAQISLEFLFNFLILLVFINFLFALLLDFYHKLKEQEEVMKLTMDAENEARFEDIRKANKEFQSIHTESGKIKKNYKDKEIVTETIQNFTTKELQHI